MQRGDYQKYTYKTDATIGTRSGTCKHLRVNLMIIEKKAVTDITTMKFHGRDVSDRLFFDDHKIDSKMFTCTRSSTDSRICFICVFLIVASLHMSL